MSDSIFQALYYGDIFPVESRAPNTEEHSQLRKRALALHEEVRNLLGDEGKQTFDTFLNTNAEINSLTEESKFRLGFVLGARLMIEVLQDTSYTT